jgi:glycerophosphoryl diester phosphodiesterase
MNEDVILTSFDHEVIRKIKSLNTNIKTGLIIEGNPVLLEEQLKESGASVLSINHYFVTKNLVERMKEIGVEIVAWTVNTKERMNELKELSENIVICTNHPDKFEEMINKN